MNLQSMKSSGITKKLAGLPLFRSLL